MENVYLGVSLYFKVIVTEVTLHSELEDGCGVVVSNGCLLGIVSHPHSHMRATPTTPDVVRKLKSIKLYLIKKLDVMIDLPYDHDTLVELSGSFSERVGSSECVD